MKSARKIKQIPVLGAKNICYYCGQKADSIDHVVPQSTIRMLAALMDIQITKAILKNRALKVWSCRECNCLLSNSLQENLRERKNYLKIKLLNKYRRLLSTPRWSFEEIEELGYVLKSYVENAQEFKEFIKQRIRW